ncbi:heparinase II/III family protein [bacterium]|nr:heparinase II/III family protein [bacterium]
MSRGIVTKYCAAFMIWTAVMLFGLSAAPAAWADPAPTGPWMPELTTYPRLFVDDADLPLLSDRATREPYATFMNRIRSRASAGYSSVVPEDYDVNRENANGRVAKNAAFLAWLEADETMADKAASVLEVMAVDYGEWDYEQIDDDIHVAEALHGYAVAFDFLAGSGLIDETRMAGIEDRFATMMANLYDDYANKLASYVAVSTNNHASKICGGMVLAAMVLNQDPDALKWFSFAMENLVRVWLEFQTAEEGAIAEGPYYMAYSALEHLPAFYAYDRLVGETATWLRRELCLVGPGCDWTPTPILNPFDDPKLRVQHEWTVRVRMPDGQMPPIDDANLSSFYNGLVAGRLDDGVLAWDWWMNEEHPAYTDGVVSLDVEAMAMYDEDLEPTHPEEAGWATSYVSPSNGQAVFRSGWEPEDSWMMMLAENGDPHKRGGGHEQGDALSVSLYARGQYLLIDSGYSKWDNNIYVREGKNHNVPTVDGEPPAAPIRLSGLGGTEAYIVDAIDDGAVPFATAEASWDGADMTRTLYAPGSDYVIVIDQMTDRDAHQYGMLWHGLAGGDAGGVFTLNADGATWAQADAGVDVHVTHTGSSLNFSTYEDLHGLIYGQLDTHSVLSAQDAGTAEDAAFVTVALPFDVASAADLVYAPIDLSGAAAARVSTGNATDIVLAQTGTTKYRLSSSDTGGPALTTSLATVVWRHEPNGDSDTVHISGKGDLDIAGLPLWKSRKTDRVSLTRTGNTWHVQTAGRSKLKVKYSGDYTVTPPGAVQASKFFRYITLKSSGATSYTLELK